jgi:hypothetical protein
VGSAHTRLSPPYACFAGDRIERVFAGTAQISGKSMMEVRAAAMAEQSIKEMIDPKDIAALEVFLASDAGKSISGQVLPIIMIGSGHDCFDAAAPGLQSIRLSGTSQIVRLMRRA